MNRLGDEVSENTILVVDDAENSSDAEIFVVRMMYGLCGHCGTNEGVIVISSIFWDPTGIRLQICKVCLPDLPNIIRSYAPRGIEAESRKGNKRVLVGQIIQMFENDVIV